MFTSKICLATVLLSLHAANPYILLTANLDDVHSLAKQLASSPVVNQVQDIISRASSIFNENTENKPQYELGNKAQMRTDPKLDEDQPPVNRGQEKQEATENSQSNSQEGQEPMKKSDATTAHNIEVWTPDKEGVTVYSVPSSALSAELSAKTSDSSSGSSGEANEIGGKPHRNVRRSGPNVAELGRNASLYLKSIKKIFEGF